AVASLLRLQARADGVEPREALEHSVNRILAIAAVHEVLTEQREDDVELAELLDRLRAMLVQGLAAGKAVEAALEPVSLAGERATALALVFSELLQNALEHVGDAVRIELARRNGEVMLAIADDGAGPRRPSCACRWSTSGASTSIRSRRSRHDRALVSRPRSSASSYAASPSRRRWTGSRR